MFLCEHWLRVGNHAAPRSLVSTAKFWGQRDVAARWSKRWDVEVTFELDPLTSPIVIDHSAIANLPFTRTLGFDTPVESRAVLNHAVVLGENAPSELPAFLDHISRSAIEELGAADPSALHIARILGLAAALYDTPARALSYLSEPSRVAKEARIPLLAGADLEASVVLAMLGRYEAALDHLARAGTSDPEFDAFHHLTRAAQGAERYVASDHEPLFDTILREGRALLRRRLAKLGNIIFED
jgi:hypothetical protein